MRIFLLPSVAFALTASMAVAQGVPEMDLSSIAQLQILVSGAQEQHTEAVQTNAILTEQLASRAEQIVALQDTINMLRGSTGMTSDLEGLDGTIAGGIYSIEDNNPYAGRLFGDARETIESMIAETAVKFGNDPALAAIGINAVEFRCWFQALVKQESRFQIGARSPKAAFGLTQIIPGTAQDLGIYPAYYENPRLQLDGGGALSSPTCEEVSINAAGAGCLQCRSRCSHELRWNTALP